MPRAYVDLTKLVMICTGLASLPLAAFGAAYDSGISASAAAYLGEAGRAAYHGRLSEAIALDNKAIAAQPHAAYAYLSRANTYMEAGRYAEATADIDVVASMHPDSVGVAIERVEIDLSERNGAAALKELDHAATMPTDSSWHQPQERALGIFGNSDVFVVTVHTVSTMHAYRSIALLLQHQDDASVDEMAEMVKNEHDEPWHVLARHCYRAAVAGRPDMAELTCQQAIDSNSHDIGQYDSLGFAHLCMKQWDKAIADYTKALSFRPDLTLSLYGRGLARRARGDIAGANADIAAATKDEPDIANIMKRLGAPVT